MSSDFVIVVVVAAALGFGFTNGFHDTLDLVATAVLGGAGSPQLALGIAAILNFLGAFISVEVAHTIATDVVDPSAINPAVVFAGLLAAIVWNLATWWFGLPSSSSHALIGGVVGATIAAAGTAGVIGGGLLDKVLLPALVAPLLAFAGAAVAIVLIYRFFGRRRPGSVSRIFRLAQFGSGGLLALAHGANDIQKTTGVITLALIANGTLGVDSEPPFWATIGAATAIAVGTYAGGMRMLRTTSIRIIKMDAAQGFSAQGAGAVVILVATFLGFPISTTHAVNGGVMGAGATKRLSAARWGIAGNIVTAWLLTLPAAAAVGALAYGVMRIAGTSALGPALVAAASVLLVVLIFVRRMRGRAAPAV
ncbi:MAG TPA: inorganic phosphate transporter [Solirubrobacterales bacterium]|nr:inorganic phosphate transporter [Solirubrobacterales bacterium]